MPRTVILEFRPGQPASCPSGSGPMVNEDLTSRPSSVKEVSLYLPVSKCRKLRIRVSLTPALSSTSCTGDCVLKLQKVNRILLDAIILAEGVSIQDPHQGLRSDAAAIGETRCLHEAPLDACQILSRSL